MKPATGWASVLLVGLMLLTVAWSIEAATPMPALGVLTPVVIGGVLAGALLGSLVWLPASLAHGWSLVMGLATTLVCTATALHRLEQVPAAAIERLSLLARVDLVRTWYLAWIDIQRHGYTYEGYRPYLSHAPETGTALAGLFYVVTMALLMWLLSYICTWFIVRYVSWWGAVLPAGFALVFNLTQAPRAERHLVYLAFFLLCAFLLAAQTHLAAQTERWRRERIGYSPDIGFELLRDGLIVTLAVIALGWLLPAELSFEGVQSATRRMVAQPRRELAQTVNRWFPTISYPDRGGGNAFPSEIGLSGSIALAQNPVFEARVEEGGPLPRYWRQAVFDSYDGRGWRRTADAAGSESPAPESLAGSGPEGAPALTVPVTQTIRTFQPVTEQLYAAPQPDRFDLPIAVETAAGGADLLSVQSQVPLPFQSLYSVVSRLSVADEESLRAVAGGDPGWVSARYLGLPESVPERVRDKAREATVGTANRYDAATAIETYLRQFPYSEQINTPPDDRDRVDWFLFDEQRGYCDYYSSAFVVLARSVGIPARVAAGYATGMRVGDGQTYRQHAFDAHTWPEVYFPGYGWIEFEPTASSEHPRIARAPSPDTPLDPGAAASEPEQDLLAEEMAAERAAAEDAANPAPAAAPSAAAAASRRLPLWPLLTGLALLAVAAGGAWLAWQRPLRGLSPAEGFYARLLRVTAWLGFRPRTADTPNEFGQRLGGAIPDRAAEIAAITEAYVRERFGRRPPDDAEADRLRASWQGLREGIWRVAGRLGWRRIRRR